MRPPAPPPDAPGPSASRAWDLKPVRALGRGRFGDVHLVRDAATDQLYALKTVAKSKQLRNEAEVLKKLRHTNIVAFVDAWEDHASDHVLMLMEYADRGDLARLLQTRWEELQPTLMLPEAEVMQWFVQIARGLAHIHSLSVLHRDLKPENIFVSSPHAAAAAADGSGSGPPVAPPILKIGDFGIARDMGTSGELASTCVGSPCYLSPELIGGSGYSYKSDVWALGVVAYRCACNRYPFDASNLAQLALKISAGSFAPLPPTYSPLFHHLVASALQMEASVRPGVDDLLSHPRVRALEDEAAAAGASGGIAATAIPSIAMAAAAAAAQLAPERTHSVPLRRRSIGDAAAAGTAAAAATAAADAAAAAAKAAALGDDDAALPADADAANADGWRSESSPSLRFASVRNRRDDMLLPAKAGATRVSALGSEEAGTALIGRLGPTVDQRPSAVDPRPPMLAVGSCRGSFYSSTTSTGEPSPRHLAGLSVAHGGVTQSPKLLRDDEAPAPLSPLSPTGGGSSSDSIAAPALRSTERRGPRGWPSGGGGMMQSQPGGASPGLRREASRADTSSFRSVNSRAERGGSPPSDAAGAGGGSSDGGGGGGGISRGARSPWSTARLLLGRGLLQQNAFDAASAGVGDDGASRSYLALNDLSSLGNSDLELDEEEAAAAAIAVLAVRSRRASRTISEAEAAAAVASLSASSDSV